MTRYLLLFFVSTLGGEAFAEAFVPPQPYSIDRYEDGWQKNPFTLKTAPVVVQQESFAKDLVLGSISKIGDSTTVVVVNAKTRQRVHLNDDQPSDAGIRVTSVHWGEKRKDIFVELAMNNDKAIVRYDDALLKQLATAGDPKNAAKTPPNGGGAPINGAPPLPNTGGNVPPAPGMKTNPNVTQANHFPQGPTGAPPAGMVNTAFQPNNNPNNPNVNMPTRSSRRQNNLPVSQPPR